MRITQRLRPVMFAPLMLLLAASGDADQRALPPAMGALEAQGVTIIEEFETTPDLRIFAAVAGQQPLAIYVTRDDTVIVGTRLDEQGRPVDENRLQQLVERPMARQAWARLAESDWVLDGASEAPRIVYTFSDPNCPYCNQFWQAARPWVDAGAVQLRHVMVGLIKADSTTKAAAILEARDRSAALRENERNFARGGIAPKRNISSGTRATLEEHRMLMITLGFRGTPGIVALDDDGLLQTLNGLPGPGALEALFGPRPQQPRP